MKLVGDDGVEQPTGPSDDHEEFHSSSSVWVEKKVRAAIQLVYFGSGFLVKSPTS